MSTQPSKAILAANLSIEVLDGVAHPICHEGECLPTGRNRKYGKAEDNEGFFEFHLLHGNSLVASENTSLGKWRINNLPSDAPKEKPIVEVSFSVEVDGRVTIKADMEGKSVDVIYLGEGIPRVQVKNPEEDGK